LFVFYFLFFGLISLLLSHKFFISHVFVLYRSATQTISQISSLQTTLSHHLLTQSQLITNLHNDAWKATDTIRDANIVLSKVGNRGSTCRVAMLTFFFVAGISLWFLDWYAQ